MSCPALVIFVLDRDVMLLFLKDVDISWKEIVIDDPRTRWYN